jgi:hypothetical protein
MTGHRPTPHTNIEQREQRCTAILTKVTIEITSIKILPNGRDIAAVSEHALLLNIHAHAYK